MCSEVPAHRDGSFERQRQVLKLMREIFWFSYIRMEKCHGCSRELSPWRRFFWAPRTTVKLDGFEGFSNITSTGRCDI